MLPLSYGRNWVPYGQAPGWTFGKWRRRCEKKVGIKSAADGDVDDLINHPTWNDVIQYYFSAPYWATGTNAAKEEVGNYWCTPMHNPYWKRTDSTRMNDEKVYCFIASGYMPPPPGSTDSGRDPKYYFLFPPEACEGFRLWLNDSGGKPPSYE